MEFAIDVRSLEKRFGDFVAVDKISFTVDKGDIFGFLGANGAGKSTTIRMLCGLLNSTSGTAVVAGHDINSQPELVKADIGYMSQRFSLYEDLTVRENIIFFGGAYGLFGNTLDERMNWAIEISSLSGMEERLTGELPGGWKQRLALACAVLHRPEIVFLDEPTSGVDPVSRRSFWDLIQSLSDKGVTVFVTTHYLDEAEYCNRIALIHAGRLIAQGSPRGLKSKYISHPMFEIECDTPLIATEKLKHCDGVLEASIFGNAVHIIADDSGVETAVVGCLAQHGISVSRFETTVPTLEDVFVHLIEKESHNAA
jgi:ABC-2 type transport system ATP-binding protein